MIRLTPEQAFERAMAYENSLQEVNTLNTNGMRKTRGVNNPPSIEGYVFSHAINFKVGDDSESGDNMYYYVNEEDGSGIITPAIGSEPGEPSPLLPLLGHLDANDGDDDDGLPPGLIDWLKSYDDEINWVKENESEIEEIINESENENENEEEDIGGIDEDEDDTIIGPLVNCQWKQSAPYNQDTVFDGITCKTGCGATAIAQILYYWGCQPESHSMKAYKTGSKKITKYNSSIEVTDENKKKIKYTFSIKELPNLPEFDYDNLLEKYYKINNRNNWNNAQASAVSQIMLYCACAAKSRFSPGLTTSSFSTFKDVFSKYLGFSNDELEVIYFNKAGFSERLKDEIRNGRPCLFYGYKSGPSEGHHFICDGYNPQKDEYHFNFGWGGKGDGWLALTSLVTTVSGAAQDFNNSNSKRALVGIKPIIPIKGDYNGDGSVGVPDIMTAVAILNGQPVGSEIIDVDDPEVIEKLDLNNDGKITIEDIQLMIRKVLGNNYEG